MIHAVKLPGYHVQRSLSPVNWCPPPAELPVGSHHAGSMSQEKKSEAHDAETSTRHAEEDGLEVDKEEEETRDACVKVGRRVWLFAAENWFVLGIVGVIILSFIDPDIARSGGYLAGQYTISLPAVIIVFFTSGLSLPTRVLLDTLKLARVHALTQALSLWCVPVLGYGLAVALDRCGLPKAFVAGLVVTVCMPTTVSTNVVFTSLCRGDEAVAVINACLGNLIGVFVSPALLRLFLGGRGMTGYAETIWKVTYTVVVPLVAGQLLQNQFPNQVLALRRRVRVNVVGSVMVLLLVWHAMSNTFHRHISVSIVAVVVVVVICTALFFSLTGLCFLLQFIPVFGPFFHLDRPPTTIAVMMVAPTKTIALGVPLVLIIYKSSPDKGLILLPLIIYHNIEVVLGNLLVPRLRRWCIEATDAYTNKKQQAAEATSQPREGLYEADGDLGKIGVVDDEVGM